jgi:Protein of unknown function (DUF3489)
MNTATTAKPITLNPTQTAVLTHAIDHANGKVAWFPETIKGGAQKKVIEGLFARAMIIGHHGDWIVTDAAYAALGRTRPAPSAATEAATPANQKAQKAVRKAKAAPKTEASGEGEQAAPRSRENSKQAQVIAMLKRPEGATIPQICEATGWQAHTVRGTFAGAFKKKLGLTVTSDKAEGGVRVYRIAEVAPAA